MRPRHAVRLLGAVLALVVLATGCSDRDGASTGSEPAGASGQPASDDPGEVEVRDFEKLARDQPGGVEHREAFPAEPTADELTEAARDTGSRTGAERFAIVLLHGLEDQTAGTARDTAEDLVAADLPADGRFYLDNLRSWKDSRVVPGSRGWLRSQEIEPADGASRSVLVQLVEKLEVPALGDGPGEPFVSWGSFLMTVTATADGWMLTDLQEAGASEYETFSPYMWEAALDSGKGWRRFRVG